MTTEITDAIDEAIVELCESIALDDNPESSARAVLTFVEARERVVANDHFDAPGPDVGLRGRVLAVMSSIDDLRSAAWTAAEERTKGDDTWARLDSTATAHGKTVESLRLALRLPCEWRDEVTS